MTGMDQARETAMKQLDVVSSKPRFGYFSIPASLAIGDGQFSTKTIKKDQLGRVAVQPRNISVNPTATGNVKSSYFSLEKSIYQGDPYMDPGKFQRVENLKKIQSQSPDKQIYKPATSVATSLMTASYPHLPSDNTTINPKSKRNQDGRVTIEPRNITSSPSSKVVSTLFKGPKYESSPYDAQHQFILKQTQQHKAKLPESQFKPMSLGNCTFDRNRTVFGYDLPLPEKKEFKLNLKIAEHDAKFKPSNPNKLGPLGTIGKFPEYTCSLPDEIKRKPQRASENKKDPFKGRSPQRLTAPSPSVTLNPVNMRRHLR